MTKKELVRLYFGDGYGEYPANGWLKELEVQNNQLQEMKKKTVVEITSSDIEWLIKQVEDLQQSYVISESSNEDLLEQWREGREEILRLKGLCSDCEGEGKFYEYFAEDFETIPCETCNGTGKK